MSANPSSSTQQKKDGKKEQSEQKSQQELKKQDEEQIKQSHQQASNSNDKNIIDESNKQGVEESKRIKFTKYDELAENIEKLTKRLEKREIARKQKKIRKRDELNDLADTIQQQSNITVSKLEDLSRKPTIFISVSKILPQIPEGFPKNYNVQIVYEDVIVTGNQKFVDFDENIIDEKFILPLLESQTAKFQIWVAEEEPSLYDKAIINIEKDIQQALASPNYQNQINFQSNPELQINYNVQLQGIGFSAWLKNLQSFRQADNEKKRLKKQAQIKKNAIRQKVEEKKNRFNKAFQPKRQNYETRQYNIKGIQQILNDLDD